MADSNENSGKGKLKLGAPSKLSLTKTVEGGKVQQKFTHGRSKIVSVEVRKTRTFAQGSSGKMVELKRSQEQENEGGLSKEEQETRMRALKQAEEAQKSGEVEKKDTPVIPTKVKREPAPAVQPEVVPTPQAETKHHKKTDHPKEERTEEVKEETPKSKLRLKRSEDRKPTGKISLNQAMDDFEGRTRSLASMRRQREKALKKTNAANNEPQEKIVRDVVVPEAITVQELANRMAERVADVVKTLMKLGMMATATQTIDADTAELVVGEFGHAIKRVSESDVENVLEEETDAVEDLKPRPPVVTVMGHVDHGKTSLLDALRKSDVVGGEAGGITQHIGAYQVKTPKGGAITFIDTPGHEAFTAMRARGAKVTDLVILVVAADDGIMAQTVEAINHAKAAEVPIIVAVNKIDKPDADSSRVKNELMQHELVPEEFGGDIITIDVSAKEGTNLDTLMDAILLQAEMQELKANPNATARGVVIEARLDQGRGVVATVLLQKGTLQKGDIVLAGAAYGRVRTLMNDRGKQLKDATPGMPVEIQGLNSAPDAGDVFAVVEDEKIARDITEYRQKQIRDQQIAATRSLEQMFGQDMEAKELPIIIKGDVQGSIEAIAGSLGKFGTDEVKVKVLHTGVGGISESDITLAHATGALIIAFNVRAGAKAKEMAARDAVEVRYYSVIYEVVDDIKAALSGLLSPSQREEFLGYAEIRQVFNVTKAGKVAGCYVTDGQIKRGAGVRLLRDNVVIHTGTLKTLKRFKDEVKEVKSGYECGMAFENYDDIREGDQIEAFEIIEEKRSI